MTTSILHFNFKTPAVIHGGVFCALLLNTDEHG